MELIIPSSRTQLSSNRCARVVVKHVKTELPSFLLYLLAGTHVPPSSRYSSRLVQANDVRLVGCPNLIIPVCGQPDFTRVSYVRFRCWGGGTPVRS